jgi:hypothetical protein
MASGDPEEAVDSAVIDSPVIDESLINSSVIEGAIDDSLIGAADPAIDDEIPDA